MPVYKSNDKTKDGRQWFYKCQYKDVFGKIKTKKSKKYKTKGETQALLWKNVDLQKGTIKINRTLTTKIKGTEYSFSTPKTKNSNRTLPLPKKLLEELKIYKTEEKKQLTLTMSGLCLVG